MLDLCIMDSCSIITACKLELASQKIIDRIVDTYSNIYIPKYLINYEIGDVIDREKNRKNIEDEDIKKIRGFIKNESFTEIELYKYKQCIKVALRWYNKRNYIKEFKEIDDGDKHCLGASLYLSRLYKKPVYLLSEDFQLGEKQRLKEFFEKQKIGTIISSLDLMIYFYLTKPEIDKNQTTCAFSDYFTLYASEKRQTDYMRLLENSCRSLGRADNICKVECIR